MKTVLLVLLPSLCLAANGPIITPTKGTTVAGPSGSVQYNSGGSLGGNSNLTFDGTTLTGAAALTSLTLTNGTSGYLLVNTNSVTTTAGPYWDSGNQRMAIGTTTPQYSIEYRRNGRGVPVGTLFQNFDNANVAEDECYSDTGKIMRMGVGGSALGGAYQDNGYLIATNDILVTPGSSNKVNVNTGDLAVSTAGHGLQIKEGSNARLGTFSLSSGAAWVPNTSVTANSVILLTIQSKSGTSSGVGVSSVTVNTGFNAFGAGTDNSTVGYFIVEGL